MISKKIRTRFWSWYGIHMNKKIRTRFWSDPLLIISWYRYRISNHEIKWTRIRIRIFLFIWIPYQDQNRVRIFLPIISWYRYRIRNREIEWTRIRIRVDQKPVRIRADPDLSALYFPVPDCGYRLGTRNGQCVWPDFALPPFSSPLWPLGNCNQTPGPQPRCTS